MLNTTRLALIVPENFIQATRDSGYKSLGSALAELVDNAFEAEARRVTISVGKIDRDTADVSVTVADDGHGMDPDTVRHSLRFGWSSRFNKRHGQGRYGMGLPNASLSYARRVEVWSSSNGRVVTGSWLDVDEVINGGRISPPARRMPMGEFTRLCQGKRGTAVLWSRCDRLSNRKLGPLCKRLRNELGRLFRYQLWAGKMISVNGEAIVPFDPLFVQQGANFVGAQPYGTELAYEVELPGEGVRRASSITVRFSELPIRAWHVLSNSEKNARGIAKNAGVSIVRASREIDRGWFFMGQKRKENYDDWWRCEVSFQPDLDELFGVTHTKQEIHPTEQLLSILVPDIERTARELNARARRTFLEVKRDLSTRESERLAERHDNLLEPPVLSAPAIQPQLRELTRSGRGRVKGLEYRFRVEKLDSPCLYEPSLDGVRVVVVLNESHPLVRSYLDSNLAGNHDLAKPNRNLELLILAAARTELILVKQIGAEPWIRHFRQSWSKTLATFLS